MKKNKLLYVAMIAAIAGCDLVTSSSDTDTSIPASSQQTTQSSISQGAGTPLSSQQASQLSSQQVVSSSVTTAEALSSSSQSLLSSAIVASSSSVEPLNELTDERDGQVYKTTTIGPQIWMAENLNFDAGAGSYCQDNQATNCDAYGRLYEWTSLMAGEAPTYDAPSGVQGLCPNKWHLPSLAEWEGLMDYVVETAETEYGVYTEILNEVFSLKSAAWLCYNVYGWDELSEKKGEDVFGFSALPGGHRRNEGTFESGGTTTEGISMQPPGAYWWTASKTNEERTAITFQLQCGSGVNQNSALKDDANSVRCVKNQ